MRGPWFLDVNWGALTDWHWRQGVRRRDWTEQRAATAGQGNVRKFWRRTKGLCVVRQTSVPACFKLSSETRSSPPAFLDIGDNPFREEVRLLHKGICLYSVFLFCKFFINVNISSFLGQKRFSGTTLPILTLRYGKITWQALEPNLGRGWGGWLSNQCCTVRAAVVAWWPNKTQSWWPIGVGRHTSCVVLCLPLQLSQRSFHGWLRTYRFLHPLL